MTQQVWIERKPYYHISEEELRLLLRYLERAEEAPTMEYAKVYVKHVKRLLSYEVSPEFDE